MYAIYFLHVVSSSFLSTILEFDVTNSWKYEIYIPFKTFVKHIYISSFVIISQRPNNKTWR